MVNNIVKLFLILTCFMSSIALLPSMALADDITTAQFAPIDGNGTPINITGNATKQVQNKIIAAQTFYATAVYTISDVMIFGYVDTYDVDHPFIVNVEIHTCDSFGVPTGVLAYNAWGIGQSAQAMPANYFTTDGNGSWIDIPLNHTFSTEAGKTYCIYVKVPSGNPTTSFYWYYNQGGAQYGNGTAYNSTNGGANWNSQGNDTYMFQLWGNTGLSIHDVAAFKNITSPTAGDWLITFAYDNKAPPKHKTKDVEQHFRVQFINNTGNMTGNITGETVLRFWDSAVGSIYLNPQQVSPIEWEWGNFTLRIIANYAPYFHVDWDLPIGNASTWQGDDLTFLDNWCKDTARWMGEQNHNDSEYYITISSIGYVLNSNGISIFDVGIPQLGTIRGSTLYSTYQSKVTIPTTAPNPQLQSKYDMTTQLGAPLVGALTDVGVPFHLTPNAVGLVVVLALYVMVVGSAFPLGHGLAGTIAGLIIILIGMTAGLVQVTWVILAIIFAVAMMLRQALLVGQ